MNDDIKIPDGQGRWPSSDDLLQQDPIAAAKVANPHDADPDLVVVGDVDDDEANAEAAACVLAEAAGDELVDDLELEDDEDDEVEGGISVALCQAEIEGV
jgi:hypothetical protein